MIIDAAIQSDVPELRSLWSEAFGDEDEFINLFFLTAFDTKRSRCVKVNGKVKAVLYWFDCLYEGAQIAYIYAVATAKDHRGRGLCSALMENTHCHLASLGYRGCVLVPEGENLFLFYKKLGYATCAFVSEFSCLASNVKTEIRQIDMGEYAKLRRFYLPKNGVVQENENLKFLQAQASFYMGDGFLLAARREEDTLYGVELLGNVEMASSIVKTLECANGRFRVPGKDIPFAMYRALNDDKMLPPEYFGLAFD